MRHSRFQVLHFNDAPVHMYWRCHNKEMYLEKESIKSIYMSTMKQTLEIQSSFKGKLDISAYCIMDNHFHQLIYYRDGALNLSNYMRRCHGIFGQKFNKIHNRSGKVAESRPKTSLIENVEHTMRVHMYIEANPIRAKKCTLKQLQYFKYCSYAFYAYGIENEFTSLIKVPHWYIELGTTPKQRQKKYRELFEQYLSESEFVKINLMAKFIGSKRWVMNEVQMLKNKIKEKLNKKPPE